MEIIFHLKKIIVVEYLENKLKNKFQKKKINFRNEKHKF